NRGSPVDPQAPYSAGGGRRRSSGHAACVPQTTPRNTHPRGLPRLDLPAGGPPTCRDPTPATKFVVDQACSSPSAIGTSPKRSTSLEGEHRQNGCSSVGREGEKSRHQGGRILPSPLAQTRFGLPDRLP